MNRTSEEKFDIREEIRLIPKAMVVLAALTFVGIQALFFLVFFKHDRHAPPLLAQLPLALIAGSLMAFFTLLIGYVNRDAKRRGMNYKLWTVLVIFIPNAIGYIIYFVVRQPIMGRCAQCGITVSPAFNFCPKCKFNLHPACPQCHRTIEVGAAYCPYCSAEVKA
ncbi:MAG: zinc ribbon domain-containing protein [Acidobacteriota bacterium]|nr:zinc ribbon domain-containing protein [Acidobacteriota bacterium]